MLFSLNYFYSRYILEEMDPSSNSIMLVYLFSQATSTDNLHTPVVAVLVGIAVVAVAYVG